MSNMLLSFPLDDPWAAWEAGAGHCVRSDLNRSNQNESQKFASPRCVLKYKESDSRNEGDRVIANSPMPGAGVWVGVGGGGGPCRPPGLHASNSGACAVGRLSGHGSHLWFTDA